MCRIPGSTVPWRDYSIGNGRHIINSGSMSKPKGNEPRACTLLLRADGRDLSLEFVRMPFDLGKVAQAVEAPKMPDEFAETLRLAPL